MVYSIPKRNFNSPSPFATCAKSRFCCAYQKVPSRWPISAVIICSKATVNCLHLRARSATLRDYQPRVRP
jgi:hypothetical protein